MEQNIKKIAVLTSGGDAPGMNAAIRAVVRTGLHYGLEVYGVLEGYKGLVEGKDSIIKLDSMSVANIITRGGTILGTARLDEFQKESVTQIGIDNLRALGVDALIVIGGDGTYHGGARMTRMGLPCIGIPGTIDNDVDSSDFTIGFDTAVNTAMEAIDKLRDTSNSHQRCTIVEVMGRHCPDIALAVGVASGADLVVTSKETFDLQTILDSAKRIKEQHKRQAIFVIVEHITDVHELARQIEEYSKFSTRATVLGHIQRGGSPTPQDRILASRLGVAAVEALLAGKKGCAIGIRNNEIITTPFTEMNTYKKQLFKGFDDIIRIIS